MEGIYPGDTYLQTQSVYANATGRKGFVRIFLDPFHCPSPSSSISFEAAAIAEA